MAKLLNCKSCGHQVAKSAKLCPNCGQKFRGFGCGWFLLLLLLLVGALVLIGFIFSAGLV